MLAHLRKLMLHLPPSNPVVLSSRGLGRGIELQDNIDGIC